MCRVVVNGAADVASDVSIQGAGGDLKARVATGLAIVGNAASVSTCVTRDGAVHDQQAGQATQPVADDSPAKDGRVPDQGAVTHYQRGVVVADAATAARRIAASHVTVGNREAGNNNGIGWGDVEHTVGHDGIIAVHSETAGPRPEDGETFWIPPTRRRSG